MEQATTIGLDIAKHVFQVHGADGAGHVLFRKRITRTKLLSFLAAQARCVVAMEPVPVRTTGRVRSLR
jgi:transposase